MTVRFSNFSFVSSFFHSVIRYMCENNGNCADRGKGTAGDVGNVYFGPNHPMKPHRLCMTHHLVLSYELHEKMEIYVRIFHSLEFFLILCLSL